MVYVLLLFQVTKVQIEHKPNVSAILLVDKPNDD